MKYTIIGDFIPVALICLIMAYAFFRYGKETNKPVQIPEKDEYSTKDTDLEWISAVNKALSERHEELVKLIYDIRDQAERVGWWHMVERIDEIMKGDA